MSKLFTLLKATMSSGLQVFDYHAQNTRNRWLMPALLCVVFGSAMFLSAAAMAGEMKPEGGAVMILPIYTLVTAVIIAMEGVYKSSDLLFRPRDNDALLAMPIKKSTIVLARVIKFYLFELLYCLIFLLPAVIAYALNAEVDGLFFLVSFTMVLLVPIIPITLSCIAGLLISAIAPRLKHKAFWQVVLSFVFMLIVAFFLVRISSSSPQLDASSGFDGQSMIAFGKDVAEAYYPASAFMNLALHFDLADYLIFIAINLAVLATAVLLISRFYFQIITHMNIARHTENTAINYVFKKHSQTSAMIRKELNRYFSTPVLLTNTAMGLLLFLVAVGALCFKFDDVAHSIMSSVEDFPLTIEELHSYLPSVTTILVAFASLMTFISATMISLEGRAFNLLKTMPISGKKVIMTKVLSATLLIVPVTAFGALAMFIVFQFNIIDMLLVLIAVITMPLVTELVGILINLKYARFDAENDTVTVRQSASIMVSTFIGLGMTLATIALIIVTVIFVGQTAGLLITDAVFVLASALLYCVVASHGENKYLHLSA